MNIRNMKRGDTPDFTLPIPNSRSNNTTDALWWFRCQALSLFPGSVDAGTYANKAGFHNKGKQVRDFGQGNSSTDYSIRHERNRTGAWWRDYCAAFDQTFPDAQRGDFRTINIPTSRLLKSAMDKNDPRLDGVLYEFYGQADNDRDVEGYNLHLDKKATSDSSHLWHNHYSFWRDVVGDFWAVWQPLTVIAGWTVNEWRLSIPKDVKPPVQNPPVPKPQPNIPVHRNGSRTLRYRDSRGRVMSPLMRGTDVRTAQLFIGRKRMGVDDGIAGPNFESGTKWYQRMRGLKVDGILGPKTWAPILRALD